MAVDEIAAGGEAAASEVGAQATAPVPGWGWTETALAMMVVIWGVNFAVAKAALQAFTPLAFNAVRFCIASALVALVLRARGGLGLPAREHRWRIVGLGVLGNVLYQLCFVVGLSRTRAGSASLILALTPVITALLSTLIGHERPGARTWGGAALSITGVALVTGTGLSVDGTHGLVGDLILVAASLLWAMYTVGSRGMVRVYGSVRTTAWTMWVGTALLVPLGVPELSRTEWGALDWRAWGGLVFSAVFAIALAYLIWYRGVERIGNTRTAIFSNLTPVVAMAAAAVLLNERPSPWALLGAALTLTGVMVVRSDPGHARPAAVPAVGARAS
ncbi:MAG TPA: DMT family transporter [Longimicrobium sp.]|nr:DMT family transporter [Longimicrobium sp.]